MASCPAADLLLDACDNKFMAVAENRTLTQALILQLFYIAAGGSETIEELLEQACENGFDAVAQNHQQRKVLLLQILCNATGGT